MHKVIETCFITAEHGRTWHEECTTRPCTKRKYSACGYACPKDQLYAWKKECFFFWVSTGNLKVLVLKRGHEILSVLRKKCLLCKAQYMLYSLLKEMTDLHGALICLWPICSCGRTVLRTGVFANGTFSCSHKSDLFGKEYRRRRKSVSLGFKLMEPNGFSKQVFPSAALKIKKAFLVCMIYPRKKLCA